jgi:PAS domain S-box-containing protein
MNIASPQLGARSQYWFAVPFLVMALLFLVTDLLAMRRVRQLRIDADDIVQDMLTDIDLVSRMRGDINRSRIVAGRHILETSSAAMATLEVQLGQTRADFAAAAAQYESMPLLPPEVRPWTKLKETLAEVQPQFDAMLALSRAHDQKAARRVFVELEGPFDRVDADLRELIDVNHTEAQNTVNEVAKLQGRSATVQQLFAISGFALSLVLGAVVARVLQVHGQRLRESRDKLAASNRELAAYARIGELSSTTKGFADFLFQLLRLFLRSCPDVDTATILLREDDPERPSGRLRAKASIGLEEEALHGYTIPIGEGFAGTIAASRQPLLLQDAARSPLVLSEWVRRRGIRAFYGVPLVSNGELVGVAHIGSQNTSDFPEEEKRLFATLAERAASAIARASLHDQVAKSEASLRAERARLATILTSAPHGIVFVDALDGHVETNPAAEEMTGYPRTGQRVDDAPGDLLFRPDGTPIPRDEWPGLRALRGESVSRVEVLVSRQDGTRLPVLMSATPVRSPEDRITGAVMAFEDITVFKELERLRDEFASIVAHDLRNPISSILMNAERLLRRPGDAIEVRAAGLERIRRAAARLGDMVKDLLDASRIEVDRLTLDRKPLAPRATVEAIVEEVRPTLGEHPVKVATEGDPAPILADPVRFDQILTNLLENAAKYSPRDAPIDVKVVPSEDGVEVTVKDEGMGIAPEDIPRLFDRFYQAKRAREMRAGLGLGLYITRGLVAAHGGRIWVDSEPAHGSTFHVWLPSTHVPH